MTDTKNVFDVNKPCNKEKDINYLVMLHQSVKHQQNICVVAVVIFERKETCTGECQFCTCSKTLNDYLLLSPRNIKIKFRSVIASEIVVHSAFRRADDDASLAGCPFNQSGPTKDLGTRAECETKKRKAYRAESHGNMLSSEAQNTHRNSTATLCFVAHLIHTGRGRLGAPKRKSSPYCGQGKNLINKINMLHILGLGLKVSMGLCFCQQKNINFEDIQTFTTEINNTSMFTKHYVGCGKV